MYNDVKFEEFYWKCIFWCYLVLGVSWGPVAVAGGTAGVSNLEAGLFELNLLNISHLTTNCWELPTLSAAFCLLHQRVSIKFVLRHSDSSLSTSDPRHAQLCSPSRSSENFDAKYDVQHV